MSEEERAGAAAEETFRLRDRGGIFGALLLLGGFALAGFTGLSLLGAITTFGLAGCGFGLALTGGGYAILFGRQNLQRLTAGPAGATLASADGSSVTVPWSTVREVHVQERVQTSSSGSGGSSRTVHYFVHLRKRDGGLIDLGEHGNRARADQLVQTLTSAMDRFHTDAEPAPKDALAILGATPHLSARREDGEATADYRRAARRGDLVITWSLRPRLAEIVPGVLVLLGIALALYGFHRHDGRGFSLVAAVIVLGIVVAVLIHSAARLMATQVLRIRDADIVVERRRGARPVEEKTIPLAAVRAVDFTFQSDTIGGVLELRLTEARAPELPSDQGAPSIDAVATLVKQAIDLHRTNVRIPLGRLPFGDRVRLDLAVSAELAQRTARHDADL